MRYRPRLLHGFLAATGLELACLCPRLTIVSSVVHCDLELGLPEGAAFVQPCKAPAVNFENVRFGCCPIVVGR
jgi:hypothetical protein